MSAQQKKSKILIVDDEPTNLKLLREVLRADYALIFARSGQEMLRYATSKPDLILLDIMMPNMDGYEGCRRLKTNEDTCDIPVIFITAKIEAKDEVEGFECGGVDYISKPVSGPVVRARIATQLALKQAREQLEQQNKQITQQNSELRAAALLREDVEQIMRHDLKSPLNQIIGVPNLLLQHLKLTEEEALLLRGVEQSGYRMLEMINRSHDIYKMEQGSYQVNWQAVDLLDIVNSIRWELQTLIEKKQLTLEVLLESVAPKLEDTFIMAGEKLLCYAMLSNLLKNAMEASPNNSIIKLLLDKSDTTNLCISNHGHVPAEIRSCFFDKYVTHGKRKGVGLGTYSARLIATTLGGTIRLDTSINDEISIMLQFP